MSKFVLTAQLQLRAPNNVRQVVNQIQNQLGSGVNVNVNTQGSAQAQRQIQRVAAETDKATSAATRMGKAFGLSIKRFAGLAIATRAVSLFTNTLGDAVRESIAFERELIKISQVTGKTVSDLQDLTNTITKLATSFGVSSNSLLKTSRILSQAGFSAREAEIALSALAKTELAPTFENIIDTTEGAVAIFNQFKKGAEALEGQLGAINAVAGKFAVEAGDLITVIRRTGGVFKAAGGDLNELIALFTSVRSTTRESAESISTGLKTIFTRIQRPRTIEFLRQYGVELQDLEGKFVGPTEAVRQLNKAFAGLDEGDLTFVEVGEEIAGFRQIGKIIPLIREFAVAQEALKVAQQGQDSLADDAATAQLALAVRIGQTQEKFQALVRDIVGTRSFQVLANTILTLADAFIKLADAIKPILPFIGLFGAFKAFKGLSSFAGGVRGGLGAGARGFARGGMVPGTGNRDTVPAMLTPGEFVIRKNSVAKLGAGNLEAMNQYATGGVVEMRSAEVRNRIYRNKQKVTKARNARFLPEHQFTEKDRIQGSVKTSKRDVRGLESLVGVKGASAKMLILKALASSNPILQGKGYEDALRVRGALGTEPPVTMSDPVDGVIGNKLYEVKRTAKSKNEMLDKAFRYLMATDGMDSKELRGVDSVDTFRVPRLQQYVMPNSLPARARNVRKRVGRYATGGAVGTDTVPALLTPGEFVVNKKSAKAIGYGPLSRMNKIGKYASGGIVRDGRNHYGVQSSLEAFQADPSGKGGSTQGLEKLDNAAKRTSQRIQQVGFGLSIALSTLQSLIGTIDENSSSLAKGTNALLTFGLQLSVATTLLESFGLGLGSEKLQKFLGTPFGKVSAGLVGIAASTFAVVSIFNALTDQSVQLEKAIRAGKEAEAERLAGEEFGRQSKNIAGIGGGLIGGGIGAALAGPIGASVGAAVGSSLALALPQSLANALNTEFTGQLKETSVALARAQATQVSTSDSLTKAFQEMDQAIRDNNLELARDKSRDANEITRKRLEAQDKALQSAQEERKKAQEAIDTPLSPLEAFDPIEILFKIFKDRNRRKTIEKNEAEEKRLNDEIMKEQQKLLDGSRSRIDEEVRDITAGQGSSATKESVEQELFKRLGEDPRDKQLKEALQKQGISQFSEAFTNLIKEVARAREQFEALNLSLGPVRASTGAANVALTNLSNNLNSDVPTLTNAVNILEASTTEAAMGISAADFEKSIAQIGEAMSSFGADDATVKKAQENARLFASAGKEFPAVFERVRQDLGGTSADVRRAATSGQLQDKFAAAIKKQLMDVQGFSDAQAQRVAIAIQNAELSDEQRGRLRSGDVSVFQEVLSAEAKEAMQPLIDAAKEAAEVEKKLIPFIKARIEAERKLVEVQQKAIDIFMEARGFEADFGGAPVSIEERRRAASARSNVLGRSAGLSDIDGSIASLRRRRQEIGAGFANAQRQPGGKLTPELEAQQNKLRDAQQDQVATIRELIQIQKDEIQTLQEKQRLEKDSIDSLLAGDIEKFFDQQAAQGAIAAAATGDKRLMGAFGAEATGAAAKELRRMRDAGVGEVFGQQIGGRGGLLETTALAGVQARGLRGPAAERAARIMAGTTDEQLALDATSRGLAGELAAAGELGVDIAAQDLQTAAQNLNEAAQAIKDAIAQTRASEDRGKLIPEQAKAQAATAGQIPVVEEKRQELNVALEEQKKAIEENKKAQELYSTWVKYATKVQKEGGTLSQKQEEIFREVISDRAEAAKTAAEAEKKVAEARQKLKTEEDTLAEMKQEEVRIQEQLKEGTIMPAGASAASTIFNSSRATARRMAGEIGAAEGRRRGEESFFGLGRFFGGGERGAAIGRERAEQTFDKTFGSSSIDADSLQQLAQFNNDFGNNVKALTGLTGIDVNLGGTSVNVNLQGGEFLKMLASDIKQQLYTEISEDLKNYRPTSTGMENSGKVLPS